MFMYIDKSICTQVMFPLLRNSPEERSSKQRRGGSVKSLLLAVISHVMAIERGDIRRKRWVKELKTPRY